MRRLRALIVDNDPGVIKLLRAACGARDYEPLVAMDGAEALQIIQRELPDLVILDTMMPKIDGFEVCSCLREWSQIPIIILGGQGAAEEKVKCLDLGADDYVTKLFSSRALLDVIGRLLSTT